MITKCSNLLLKNRNNYCLKLFFKFIFLVLFYFLNFIIINAQWIPCNNGLSKGPIFCFISESKNIYAGIDGGVFLTSDYGDHWIAKNNGFISGFFPIHITSLAISGNNIYAGTWDDGLYISTNKGDYWEHKSNGLPYIFSGDTLFLEIIKAIIIYNNNIFIGTTNGIYISTNKGDNWDSKNAGIPQLDTFNMPVYSMAIKENSIYIGTDSGIYLTTNNGENWNEKNIGIGNWPVYSLIINENDIFAGTEYGGIFLSIDNGDSWKYIGKKDTIIATLLVKDNYILAGGGFYVSSNNGKDWTNYLNGIGVLSITINGEYVFVGTASYGVLRAKLSDLGLTDVKEQEQTNEIKIIPNPASDEFRLKFNTPSGTTVQLSVFDLLGNCILSQALQSTEGTNEKTINCEKLPQGYYFVKIKVNENLQTIPLLIIK